MFVVLHIYEEIFTHYNNVCQITRNQSLSQRFLTGRKGVLCKQGDKKSKFKQRDKGSIFEQQGGNWGVFPQWGDKWDIFQPQGKKGYISTAV